MGEYWNNICALNKRQEEKGIKKYGVALEENVTLTPTERVNHLQEELLDALKYCEHLKENVITYTPNDYQRAAMRTCNTNVTTEKFLHNSVYGIIGETGEIVDILKKHIFQQHPMDKEKLALEIGDVCWYLATLAKGIGYDFEDILKMNIEKLGKRYSGEGFEADKSINRTE